MFSKRILLNGLLFIFYTSTFFFMLEAWHRTSLKDVYTWLIENPYVFLLNLIILISLFLLLLTIIGRLRVSLWIVSFIMLTLFTVSRIKMSLKGEPLLPWDVFLGNEAANIREYFILMSSKELIIFLIMILFTIAMPLLISNKKISIRNRILIFCFPLTLFLLLYFEKPLSLLEIGDVNNVFWDQSITYQRNGVHVGFINTLQLINIDPPKNYSESTIKGLAQDFNREAPDLTQKPNIIIVMNEAFWDPMKLPNIQFSEDPLPFFRQLQNKHTSGELLVPVFGGSTANTEFEILTGNSMFFLPQGSIPYSQYIHHPQPTMASILRNNGYKTVALHNYHNWFYRRDQVYELFGFERFISQSFFENPEYRRQLISDREMVEHIVKEHKKSEKPLFAFAVTMQNHGPYNVKTYEEDRITVQGNIPIETKKVLNTYSTGVRDADDSLRLLVNYFEKVGEPTVVVFFGDHLPYLGAEYRAYLETGYIQGANLEQWSNEEYERMYRVPFVVWDNFSLQNETDLYMNSSLLSAFLLKKYQIQQTPYMSFLNQLLDQNSVIISNNQNISNLSKNDAKIYSLFQYDQLFGKRYAVPDHSSIQSNEYMLGSDLIQINEVAPNVIVLNQVEENVTLTIKGENFTYKSKVIINGEEVETTFQEAELITANIPSALLGSNKTLQVSVAIKDSKNRVLSSSEVKEVEIK